MSIKAWNRFRLVGLNGHSTTCLARWRGWKGPGPWVTWPLSTMRGRLSLTGENGLWFARGPSGDTLSTEAIVGNGESLAARNVETA